MYFHIYIYKAKKINRLIADIEALYNLEFLVF
jgi:hypothetical protein